MKTKKITNDKSMILEKEQAHTKQIELDVIGQLLKCARERKYFSTDDISKNLCLQKIIIESIENGKWQNLPHMVYVRGYIRKYAELLGIYDQIIPYFSRNISSDKDSLDICEKEERKSKSILFEKQEDNNLNQEQFEQRAPSYLTKHLLYDNKTGLFSIFGKAPKALYVYSFIIVLILTFFILNTIQNDRAGISKLENAVQIAKKVDDSDMKVRMPDVIDNKKLMITCHERTWISAIIDNTEKKEFMLKPQEVVMFNAREKFDLLVGNAGGVKLIFNGKDTGFAGESGQVKRITLP